MKKIKLNLDKKAIQDFFVQHVEKVLLVAVALFFLLFVYRAVGRETYTRTPGELTANSRDAENKVAATAPVPPEDLFEKKYREKVEKNLGQIEVEDYRQRHLWRPLIFEPPPKREEPRLFTVKDLRGAPGYGAVKAMAYPGGGVEAGLGPAPTGPMMAGESVRGERWVVLTGLVPYADQVKAYYEAFKNVAGKQQSGLGGRGIPAGPEAGMGPDGTGIELPMYLHYLVERAELTSPGQSVDNLDWQPIHVRNAKNKARRDWGTGPGGPSPMGELGGDSWVSPIFIIRALVFPTPPLAGRKTVGEEFAHPPEIPIVQRTRPMLGRDGRPIGPVVGPDGKPIAPEKPVGDEPTPEKPAPKTPPADQPGDLPGGEDMPMMPGMMPGMRPGMQPGPGPEMMPGMEGQMYPGEMGMMSPEMMMPGVGPMGPFGGQQMQKLAPYRLFLFVDRDVEPGKRYRYRVRLMLWNPNYGKKAQYLERPELGTEKFITTDWSEPTGVIQVPRDDRLLVVSVRPSVRAAVEPAASVVLVKWLHDEGVEADKEEEKVYRGQMLNLPNCVWPEKEQNRKEKKEKKKKPGPGAVPGMEDLETYMETQPPETAPMAASEMYGGRERKPIDLDYLTESLILDMRGGHRIDLSGQGRPPNSKDSSVNAPGEILLLDPEGRLVVRTELDDAAEYERLQERKKGPGEGSMQPGMHPGMYPGMEGMPDEMYLMGPQPQEKPGKGPSKKGKDRKQPSRTGPLRK